ncbi:MAG: carbamoyl-phosphate synthase large subunit [Candidatus Anstonellales archaeon]
MPKDASIKKVLIIGSGPIVIGQSAEFDYSGSQACTALKEEGVRTVLVNSNPATIQTDKEIADIIYIEPLRSEFVEKIIKKERPDGIIATMGGQTALNLAKELHDKKILEKYGVRVLGTGVSTIELAEDREKFKETLSKINQPYLRSAAVSNFDEAERFLHEISFPVILRPAYTLGGTGGGKANNMSEFEHLLSLGLRISPIGQVLVEESVAGWAELEYEVLRDAQDNCICICNMENVDPMGIHTGESIVVAPSQTLSDVEHQMLRKASIDIVRALGVVGGCNVQFALDQKTGRYVVVEVNPRLSRSSALASKATGYPIARIAAKLALGYSLYELRNMVTGTTPASFEPALDYVVTKIPRWPFDKIPECSRTIGTQMKSTGEVMAIGRSFEESLQKALRSLEIKKPKIKENEIEEHLSRPTDFRIFAIFEAFRRGWSIEQVYRVTAINRWFLNKIKGIIDIEKELESGGPEREILKRAKKMGFSDAQIGELCRIDEMEVRRKRKEWGIMPVYKMVDTCAAEFEAKTPYYYSTYSGTEDEVQESGNENSLKLRKGKVLVVGSGPIRIGQGIEFDYCCCHASFTLRECGYESIMINNNPETISTDFDASDRLYFEPLTFEDVMNVIEREKPDGVIVQFGGQTSINLAQPLATAGVKILGTQAEDIDTAEDRERFRKFLESLGINQPENGSATSEEEALSVARRVGYPVIVRPSYVIAGRAMKIVYSDDELRRYIEESVEVSNNHPVLIDKYIEKAVECEIDGVSDGEELFVGGIMEHIERAGVHSGDASCVTPPIKLIPEVQKKILEYSKKIALGMKNIGAINIQYVVKDNVVYVLEANPRASRTIPYLSKAINVPLAKIATKVILGKKLSELSLPKGGSAKISHYAVKSVVFPFLKMPGVDFVLGPEMRSTGEAMGIDYDFGVAYYKSLLGANLNIPIRGAVLISLKKEHQEHAYELGKRFSALGFVVCATEGTAKRIGNAVVLNKAGEGEPNVISSIKNGMISLVINTPSKGKDAQTDGFKIRRVAIESNIACITNLEAAFALLDAMESVKRNGDVGVRMLDEFNEMEKRG